MLQKVYKMANFKLNLPIYVEFKIVLTFVYEVWREGRGKGLVGRGWREGVGGRGLRVMHLEDFHNLH